MSELLWNELTVYDQKDSIRTDKGRGNKAGENVIKHKARNFDGSDDTASSRRRQTNWPTTKARMTNN